MNKMVRETCWRCRRPIAVCWCAHVPRLTPRTRVTFLQHPRERHMPIGTARMAHLALAGSRLIEGVAFDDDPRVADLFSHSSDVAVLFPGPQARTLETWHGPPPSELVVLDGTWHQAAKLLRENPRLAALPRLAFTPPAPGRYRIRKEPRDECLSTIEAVGAILAVLEHDEALAAALMRPFDAMVETQLDYAARARRTADDGAMADERGRVRHSSRRDRRGTDRRFRELLPLLRHPERVVVLYAEANAAPREARGNGAPGLLQLVAARPLVVDAPAFACVVRPVEPVHEETLRRLGLTSADVDTGLPASEAVTSFRAWCGDGRLLTWGAFPRDLLAREGDARRGFVDLRALACRALDGSCGGLEAAAQRLDVVLPATSMRASRMLEAAVGVARVLVHRVRNEQADESGSAGILPS
jgi:DTW domain-containing protein YfiP